MDRNPKLLELIARYGRLVRLEDDTRQERGRKFNALVSDLLEEWGFEPRANVRGVGEADVLCKVGDVRYVIEAKWQAKKATTTDIAKLEKRVRQRPTGTLGLMIAMAGYTREALKELGRGNRIEVLLLTKEHWEAMLSGLVPPDEMVELVRDHALVTGCPYSSLAQLLQPRRPFQRPSVQFATHYTTHAGVAISPVITGIESANLGLAAWGDLLFLTTTEGIVRVDSTTRTVRDVVNISVCMGDVLPQGPDDFLFARQCGVAAWAHGTVKVLGGGYFGATTLLGINGSALVFDNGGMQGRPFVSNLGAGLSDQVDTALDLPSGTAGTACLLSPDLLLTAGNGAIRIFDLVSHATRELPSPAPNLFSSCQFADGTVWVCGDLHSEPAIYELNTETGEADFVVSVPLMTSAKAMAAGPRPNVGFLAAYEAGKSPLRYSVVRVDRNVV